MIRYIFFLTITIVFLANGITPEILDKLRIPHDPPELNDDYMTTLLDCELRAGPGPFFASIGQIPAGTKLPIIFWIETHQEGTWIRTEYDGKKGWIEDRLYKDESLVKYSSNDEPFTTLSLEDRCIITQSNLLLHKQSWEDSEVLAVIPAGTLLRCYYFMMTNPYSYGAFEIEVMYNNVKGWIRLKDTNTPIQAKSENSDKEYITALCKLNLHEKPGESAKVIDVIPAGTKLPLIFWSKYGSPGPWIQTIYKGELGWICGEKHFNWVVSTNDGKPLEERRKKELGNWDDSLWDYPATHMIGKDEHKVWRSGPGISFPPLENEDIVGNLDFDGYIVFVEDNWALVSQFIWMGWVPIDIDGKPNMIIYSDLSSLYEGLPQANPKEVADSNWDYVSFSLHGDGYPPGNRLYIELAIYFYFKGDIDSMAIKPVTIYQPPEASEPLYKGEAKLTHSSGIYETGHFYYAMDMPPTFKFDAPFRLDATIKCKGVKELEITYPPPPEE